MQDNATHNAEILSLAESVCSGSIAPEQYERLNALLRADEGAAEVYAIYVRMHGLLAWHWQDQIAVIDTSKTAEPHAGFADTGIPGSAWRGTIGFFSQTVPFSYLTAMLVVGAMLLGAWAYKISVREGGHFVADQPAAIGLSQQQFVGRVTGMKDCFWSDKNTSAVLGAFVPFGREYALSSGLLEITYDSGARVVLEGPCEYTVDSSAGGFLRVGKLVARVEKNGGLRMVNDESKRIASNIHHSSFINHHLFAIRTPTAIVTDLGTEFGVEVDELGNTTSSVFRGIVRVSTGKEPKQEVVLHADESARVEKKNESGEVRLLAGGNFVQAAKFVRRLNPPPKRLDLLDMIAGGDGTGHRRERGIDPATGKEAPFFLIRQYLGSDQYKNVDWHSLIDGIFVPQRNTTVIQLDSAGHTFDGFGHGTGGTFCTLWARAADVSSINQNMAPRYFWVYSMGPAKQFQPNGGGLLCIRSCTGITFDLAAMRKMFPGGRPARFRATAGMGDAALKYEEPYGMADLWIFIDGRLKYNRKQLQVKDGPIEINLDIGPEDRFFTLVTTDSHNGCKFDWVVYGEPVFEMASTDSDTQISPIKQSQPGE